MDSSSKVFLRYPTFKYGQKHWMYSHSDWTPNKTAVLRSTRTCQAQQGRLNFDASCGLGSRTRQAAYPTELRRSIKARQLRRLTPTCIVLPQEPATPFGIPRTFSICIFHTRKSGAVTASIEGKTPMSVVGIFFVRSLSSNRLTKRPSRATSIAPLELTTTACGGLIRRLSHGAQRPGLLIVEQRISSVITSRRRRVPPNYCPRK